MSVQISRSDLQEQPSVDLLGRISTRAYELAAQRGFPPGDQYTVQALQPLNCTLESHGESCNETLTELVRLRRSRA